MYHKLFVRRFPQEGPEPQLQFHSMALQGGQAIRFMGMAWAPTTWMTLIWSGTSIESMQDCKTSSKTSMRRMCSRALNTLPHFTEGSLPTGMSSTGWLEETVPPCAIKAGFHLGVGSED